MSDNAEGKELLRIKQRRLEVREKQAASYGIDVPPHIVTEIEDLQREIHELERSAQVVDTTANAAVSILSSFLNKTGDAAATQTGERIYQTLKAHFGNKAVAQEALADLERAPSDDDFLATLRVRLKKLLAEDEALNLTLQHVLEQAGEAEQGTTIIKQVAGDNAKQIGQVIGNITFGRD